MYSVLYFDEDESHWPINWTVYQLVPTPQKSSDEIQRLSIHPLPLSYARRPICLGIHHLAALNR